MSGVIGRPGVFATQDIDPNTIISDVDPTVDDDQYQIGTHWINTASDPERVFILVDNTPGAANWDQVNAPSGTGITYGEQYTYTDTANEVIGPLNNPPVPLGGLSLFPDGGPVQFYSVDYTVREVTGGSADGFYICVGAGSTAPGGGAFVGGVNPSPGVADVLASGDKVRVIYPA